MKKNVNESFLFNVVREDLYKAIEGADINKVKNIVKEYGITILENYGSFSALHVASIEFREKYDKKDTIDRMNKMLDIIKYLAEQNHESINYKDSTGCTPFAELLKNIACMNKSHITQDMIDLLKNFIGYGADLGSNAQYVEVSWMDPLEIYIENIGDDQLTSCFKNAYNIQLAGKHNTTQEDQNY